MRARAGRRPRLRRTMAALRADLARAGIVLDASPVDSRSPDEVPLQLTSARYVAMQAHFDTIGPAGRRMMRCTASTQVCLDWWPGRAGLEQWRVLNLAGPHFLPRGSPGRPVRARGSRPGSRSTPAAPRSTTGCCAATTRWRRTPPSRGAPRRSPAPTSTCPRCSRRCGRAAATSRSASSTSSPRNGWPRWSAPSPALMYDDAVRGRVLAAARARGAPAGRAVARGGRRRASPAGTSGGVKTLFVTDPLAGLSADIDASSG